MQNKKKIIFIFARKNSQGIKNKNTIKIRGIPLIVIAIKIAKQIVNNNNIYLSSDSLKYKKIAKENLINFIKRPKKLASSKSAEILSWKHAINFLKNKKINFDTFVSLPSTAPLRKKIDVLNAIKKLKKNIDIVLTANNSQRNPYFNMVKKNKKNFYDVVIKHKKIFRRQDAPQTYDLNTVAFVSKPNFILKAKSIFDGRVNISLVPVERSLDIDNKFDIKVAKLLVKNGK